MRSSGGLDDAENRCSNSSENLIGRIPTISSIVAPPNKPVHCVNQTAWRLTYTHSRLVSLLLHICSVQPHGISQLAGTLILIDSAGMVEFQEAKFSTDDTYRTPIPRLKPDDGITNSAVGHLGQ